MFGVAVETLMEMDGKIFVSNDFFERDHLYINNQDGTFTEDLTSQMKSIKGISEQILPII